MDEEKILRYERDENNTPMVSQIMYKGKLSDSGSQTARAILIEAIDSDIIVNCRVLLKSRYSHFNYQKSDEVRKKGFKK
ncbi:MAG: hypothetical protein K2O49_04220 [Muribaculaceae bacterium]|nr:hypothetical protein [Muribaculaceae bacterium]